ncbi:fumarylacetoacetate hydrolase family protein [Desulfospira joergensenii]|uniref:fumarylacetoacetate hydrolase family protein n=1 Tax=Desulfospira joergensenii TaxID=53329 RepID=UPI0003B4D007|nr:fumarylacetoacetate hydrolase family protein [Desulfospira joergensenii]
MKIIRFLTSENVVCLGCGYDGTTAMELEGSIYEDVRETGQRIKVEKLLAPVDPRAIIGIGLNYKLHAKETGVPLPEHPVVFMKNPGAAAAHEDPIVIPGVCADKPEVDYEAELAVIIGRDVKNVSPENALESVLGYTCANDVSARRWQKHGGAGQWVRGKSFDGFCPFGPVLFTRDEIKDPQDLGVQCVLNGETMQDSRTNDMIFSVAEIIAYLSQSTTLKAGTLVLTGTPEGVGFTRKPPVYLKPGDVVEIKLEGMDTLRNKVVSE